MSVSRIALPIGIVALISVILLLTLSRLYEETFGDQYQELRLIQIGASEADVVRHLGEPFKKYTRDEAPAYYYIDGYSFKRRPIIGKVYIYLRREAIAYVYINPEGIVEDVFIGGS